MKLFAILLLSTLLSACGSGGGTEGTSPTPSVDETQPPQSDQPNNTQQPDSSGPDNPPLDEPNSGTPIRSASAKIYYAFQDEPLMGMNLAGNVYYSVSLYYKDLMRSADPWRTSDESGTRWDEDIYFEQIPKRADGYPTHVPFAVEGTELLQSVVTPVSHGANRSFGIHHVFYQGEGRFELNGAQLVREEPGVKIYDFGFDHDEAIVLILQESSLDNPIHGVAIVHEDDISTYQNQPFNDRLKADLGDISVIRLMDMMFTNGNAASEPEHIPPMDYYTWNDCPGEACDVTHFAGHPPQILMQLIEHLDTHAWLTIPHQASDAYVRRYAELVYAGLPEDKSVLVEYSNELWNWLFSQTQWLAVTACADSVSRVDLEESPGQCDGEISSRRYQTKRTLEIVNIFRDVFGEDRDRVISVLAGQGSWGWRTLQSMEALNDASINPHGQGFDAIAIAPYFGGEHIANQEMRDFYVNSSFETLREHAFELINSEEVTGGIREHKALAVEHNAELIAYEGGQHFLCGGEYCDDSSLMDKLADFQRHDVMEEIYEYYYQTWFDEGGSLFAVFSHMGTAESRFGAWGTSEYYDQSLTEVPKKRALLSAIDEYRLSDLAPATPPEDPIEPDEPTEQPDQPGETPVSEPETTRKTYIFGHSLIYHQPPVDFNPNTTVPYWVDQLASAAGNDYSFSGQYGFLRNHATFPPYPTWGFEGIDVAWTDETSISFAEVDFDSILFTAANFIQYQGVDVPYDGDNPENSTPLEATLAIIDWVATQEPGIDIYLYENWPDMSYLIEEDESATATQLTRYHADTVNTAPGGFHYWWLDYHDRLLTLRPDANVKMIPVGPAISHVLTSTALSSLTFDELYEDEAPHGRANIYFLAGMVTYMAMYGEMAPVNWDTSESVQPLIVTHYDTINQAIWDYLNQFESQNGQSRVFD